MRIIFAALAVSVLAGCATGAWQRPGSTRQEFDAERYQCMREVYSALPPNQVAIGGGQVTPGTTNCITTGAYTNCTSTPAQAAPPITFDSNKRAREQAFAACMQGRGWIWHTR